MPSEDAKPLKRHSVKEEVDDDEDEKSLGSILKNKKPKPPVNISAPKPRPKEVKVKKEEVGDGDQKKPLKPPGSGSGGLWSTSKGVAKVKKGENDEDDEDDKPISRKISIIKPGKDMGLKKKVKQEEVKKTVKVEEKKNRSAGGSAVENGKKREKKVFDLPGQKRDPPEERDPLRIFYESLHKQIPHSEMAQIWMMESGLLSKEEAKKVFEKKQRKSHAQRLRSPAKAAVSVKRSSETVSVKKGLSSSVPSEKTAGVKVLSKQSKKRKDEDRSSGEDSDDDFIISTRIVKRQKGAN